jgi:hypothetical protein
MTDDDRNRRHAHGTGNRVVRAFNRSAYRADLALDPFGMERRSFACGRELQRAVRQTLIEPSTDRVLQGNESPRDRGVIDAEQPRRRAQRFSPTDGEDIAKIVPIESLHFCRYRLQ